MKSWDTLNSKEIDTPQEMIDFLDEIEQTCKKYNLSISHEDSHGAFEIERYNQSNIEWLKSANCSFM